MDVALILRQRSRLVHAGFAGVGVDEPRRRRSHERVADLLRPQRTVGQHPAAAQRLFGIEEGVAGEVDDVVGAAPEPAAAIVPGHDLVNVRVAPAVELEGDADLFLKPLEQRGDMLGLVTSAGQLPERLLAVQNRVADDQHAHAAGAALRRPAHRALLHEDLPAERVALAQPVLPVVHQLPRIAHELLWNLQQHVQIAIA